MRASCARESMARGIVAEHAQLGQRERRGRLPAAYCLVYSPCLPCEGRHRASRGAKEKGIDLFARVRARILDGTLWPLSHGEVLGSCGTGEPCAVCDQPITADEVEYEVTGPVLVVRAHLACYHAWMGESQLSAGENSRA